MQQNIILQGDCLEKLKELPDESIDCVLTDPPYGDNFNYGRNKRTIKNNESPLYGLLAVQETYRVLKNNTNAYVFLDIKHQPFIDNYFRRYSDFKIRDYVVWDKVNMGMGYGFRKRHELILVLEKGKPKYKNLGLPNVINVKRVNTDDHPHKKPVELLKTLIEQSTDVGGVVLDPFAGSCSVAVAAKETGRNYICFETETEYIKICNERLLV